jgi:RHS repeat-associated protein
VRTGSGWVREAERWTIDGTGRPVEQYVSIDDPGRGYTLSLVRRIQYPSATNPSRRREEQRLDFPGATWITTDYHHDGLGRVVSRIDHRNVPGAPDPVTSYMYDATGSLRRLELPDPSADTGATVVYLYQRDALGRLRRIVQPDGSTREFVYAGLDHTVIESEGGSRTLSRYDVFGDLVQVHEYDNPTEGSTAVTRYTYDDQHRLEAIRDAEGTPTQITYDWVGTRRSITRGGRTWSYTYDLNRNMASTRPPVAEGEDPALHHTTYRYDDLDRPLSRTPGTKGLSADRLAELGIGDTSDRYDEGPNGLGRLTTVGLPFGTVTYQYDARGHVAHEGRTFAVRIRGTAVTARQWVKRQHNALGKPTSLTYDDGHAVETEYDGWGMVQALRWSTSTSSAHVVASYRRSLGGLPRVRLTDFAQVREWTYDVLGRPETDVVRSTPAGTVQSARSYTYGPAGDVRKITGTLDGLSLDASYGHDRRHRILSATGPAGYAGTFAYPSTGTLTSASVAWPSGTQNRIVAYVYDGVDPEAPSTLLNADGTLYAEFTYDRAGNLVRRVTPTGEWHLVWDSDDRLREARGPTSTERYFYDHNGTRVLALEDTGSIRFWFGERETHFSASGLMQRRYLHLADGGDPLARVQNETDIELHYADPLRSLVLSLDATGNPVSTFLYGAFGEIVVARGADAQRHTFNGKQVDSLTGLRYYGARYYDPILIRWTSADPLYRFNPEIGLDDPRHLNLYAFSLNNPVTYLDTDGRQAEDPHRRLKLLLPCTSSFPQCIAGLVEAGPPAELRVLPPLSEVFNKAMWALCDHLTPCKAAVEARDSYIEAGMSRDEAIAKAIFGLGFNLFGDRVAGAFVGALRIGPPRNAHLAGKTHETGVPFDADGYPDFRAAGLVKTEVKITQTGTRYGDFKAANQAAGFKKGTPEGLRDYLGLLARWSWLPRFESTGVSGLCVDNPWGPTAWSSHPGDDATYEPTRNSAHSKPSLEHVFRMPSGDSCSRIMVVCLPPTRWTSTGCQRALPMCRSSSASADVSNPAISSGTDIPSLGDYPSDCSRWHAIAAGIYSVCP